MAQDNGQDYAAGPSVTLLSTNVNNAAQSAWTSAVDFGNPAPWGFGYELKLDAQAGADGSASLEVAWSHDNTDFSDNNNGETVATMDCAASTVGIKSGAYPVRARYAKFRIDNQSGGTINSASSALVLTDIYGDIA